MEKSVFKSESCIKCKIDRFFEQKAIELDMMRLFCYLKDSFYSKVIMKMDMCSLEGEKHDFKHS